MSLINQMLRDLEARRKVENPQLAAKPVVLAQATRGRAGVRWFWLVLLGIALGVVAWFALAAWVPWTPEESVKVARSVEATIVENRAGQISPLAASIPLPDPATAHPTAQNSAALVATPGAKVDPAPLKAKESFVLVPQQKSSTAVEKVSVNQQPAEAPPKLVVPVAAIAAAPVSSGLYLSSGSGAKDVSLRELGIVEGIDSVRLMFEFDRLPAYRVSSGAANTALLTVLFSSTAKGVRLEIPPFRGPLLKNLELASAEHGLQFTVEMAKPSKIQAFSLPADAAHGVRLLVELSVDRGFQVRAQGAEFTVGAGHGQSVRGSGDDANEQAEVLSRKAARYLEQGDVGAAKIQLSKALELTPANVELRQQLVDLLIKDQQIENAEKLLRAGLILVPSDPALRTRYGHLLFDRNQLTEALELLLAKPIPALPEQPDYHALLAAVEQESGHFANAATRYRELVQVRPAQSEWWLLLAIAYEQLNDVKLASSAYRQALEKAGLSTEHRQFSLKRLERLQRLEN